MEMPIIQIEGDTYNRDLLEEALQKILRNDVNEQRTNPLLMELSLRAVVRFLPLVANTGEINFFNRKQPDGEGAIIDRRVEFLATVLSPVLLIKNKVKNHDQFYGALNTSISQFDASSYFASRAKWPVIGAVDGVYAFARLAFAAYFRIKARKDGSEIEKGHPGSVPLIQDAKTAISFCMGDYFFQQLKEDLLAWQQHGSLIDMPLWVNVPDVYIQAVNSLGGVIETLKDTSLDRTKDWGVINSALMFYKSTLSSDYLNDLLNSAVNMPPKDSLLYAANNFSHPENPAKVDKLNRQALVDALTFNLMHEKNKGHRTIGLLGDWGSGKSSFIELLKKIYRKNIQSNLLFLVSLMLGLMSTLIIFRRGLLRR